ncbi:MAG: MFS transporter [SAR324 cluster bacterium]|nr:MFS transporter [SAR324 cluster bacterium]
MFYGWYIVIACCLISFYVSGAVLFGFTAVFKPIVEEFGWSYTQISFGASIRGLETGILIPIAGMIMDRWGQRRLVFGGCVISFLGFLLLSNAHTLLVFYAAFVLLGTGLSATINSLMMAGIANWFHRKVGLAMGIAAAGVALGGLTVPWVTFLIDTYGWRQAMLFLGIGMLVFPLPLSLLLRHKPEDYGTFPDGEDPQLSLNKGSTSVSSAKIPDIGAKQALKTKTFMIISAAYLCEVMGVSGVLTHIMPYLETVQIERSSASFIAGALPLVTIFGRIGFGWFGDRSDRRRVASLAFAMNSLGILFLALTSAEQIWLLFIAIFFFSIGWGGAVPMMASLLKSYFGTNRLGTIVGFVGLFMMIGMMTGAPLAGYIFDRWGNYQPAWYILSGIMGVASSLFFFLQNPHKIPGDMPINGKEKSGAVCFAADK